MDLEEILNNHQYRIKLGMKPYLCSGINIVILVCSFIFFETLVGILVFYLVLSMFAYKFFFNLTRNGDQYSPFLTKKAIVFFSLLKKKRKKGVNNVF